MGQAEARSRASRGRRARAGLLWGLAAFVASQVGAELVLSLRYPHLVDEEVGPKLVDLRRRLARSRDPLLVVALGSSRVGCGFEPARLEAPLAQATGRDVVAYNLAVPGGGPVTQLVVLRRLLAAGVRPDLVVLEAFVPYLADFWHCVEGAVRIPERLSYDELRLATDPYDDPGTRELVTTWWFERPFPLHRHRLTLQPRLLTGWPAGPHCHGWGEGGWAPMDRAPSAELRAQAVAVARLQYDDRGHADVGGPGVDALRESLALLAARSIPRLLVVLPTGPTYRGWYRPETQRSLDAGIGALASACDVTLVDAQRWHESEDDFVDSHHLCREAAPAFTARLGREHVLPALAGRTARWVDETGVAWEGGFSSLERADLGGLRWCGPRGALVLRNPGPRPRAFALELEVHLPGDGAVWLGGDLLRAEARGETTTISRRIVVPPGERAVTFDSDARPVDAPADPRTLVFQVRRFRLVEEELPTAWEGLPLGGADPEVWRRCEGQGRLTLVNDGPAQREVVLAGRVRPERPGPARLVVTCPDGGVTALDMDERGARLQLRLRVPPGAHDVRLRCDGPFRLEGLALRSAP